MEVGVRAEALALAFVVGLRTRDDSGAEAPSSPGSTWSRVGIVEQPR
jgi:hypothetical protein